MVISFESVVATGFLLILGLRAVKRVIKQPGQ